MKKIIVFLVAAIICVGGAFAFNQSNSNSSDKEISQKESGNSSIDKNKGEDKSGNLADKDTSGAGEDSNEEQVKDNTNGSQDKGSSNIASNQNSVNPGSGSSNTSSGSTTNNENPGEESGGKEEEPEKEPEKVETVTIAINIHNAIDYGILNEDGFGHLPSNGVILGTTTVEIKKGDNVYDVLAKVVRDNKIHMEYTGVGSAIYIQGIANLYEFDCGQYSGWMYEVNGVYPNYGVGAYDLKDGDRITFNYTCDLGADLGSTFN